MASNLPTRPAASNSGLSEQLRASVLPLWQRQSEHPFLEALGDGSLPLPNFIFYICQDALFLDVLTRTFASGVGKATSHEVMEQLGKYVLDTLSVESDLHRRYGRRFQLTPSEMAATPLAPTNYAYTRHLLSIAATGTLPELLTAVLPCAWIYAEVSEKLVGQARPAEDHPYADWLNTYASPDFALVGAWLRATLDASAPSPGSVEEARLFEIFRFSTCYEWLFWEMAWRKEAWPI